MKRGTRDGAAGSGREGREAEMKIKRESKR